jgi:hypothetical protein
MKTATDTPVATPAPAVANAPLGESNSLLNRARSILGQTPRLESVTKKTRLSRDGETKTTFEGFDWERVPASVLPRVRAAVALVIAAENEERAKAAHAKALEKFSESL